MKTSENVALELDWKTVFYPLMTLIIIISGGWIIYQLREIITVLMISVIIAYLLEPFASILEGKGLSRSLATLIVFVFTGIVVGIIFSAIIPPLIEQFERIQSAAASGRLDELMVNLEDKVKLMLPQNMGLKVNIKDSLSSLLSSVSGGAVDFALSLLSTLSITIIIPVAVFFFIKDGHYMKKSFVQLIPNKYFEMVLTIIHKIDLQLGGYLRGLLIDAGVIAALASIALWTIGMPNFIIVGIFAGFANMIPYVGPLAGALGAIVVNFVATGSFDLVLPIVVSFAIVQIVDNAVVQPLVISKNVAINPITIILAILIGGQFYGLIGMFIAVPAASIIKVTSIELYKGIRKYV